MINLIMKTAQRDFQRFAEKQTHQLYSLAAIQEKKKFRRVLIFFLLIEFYQLYLYVAHFKRQQLVDDAKIGGSFEDYLKSQQNLSNIC